MPVKQTPYTPKWFHRQLGPRRAFVLRVVFTSLSLTTLFFGTPKRGVWGRKRLSLFKLQAYKLQGCILEYETFTSYLFYPSSSYKLCLQDEI